MTKSETRKRKAKYYQEHREEILREKKSLKNRKRDRENKRRWRNANRKKYNRLMKRWRKENPERLQAHLRKSSYGLTQERFEFLLKKQKNRCAICRMKFIKTPHVDHDPVCCPKKAKSCGQCVRALLCGGCNIGLGHFKNSIRAFSGAIKYLRKYNGRRQQNTNCRGFKTR